MTDDASGRLAAEYGGGSGTAPCTTCYMTPDAIGSTRLVTDGAGGRVARCDFSPFGREIARTGIPACSYGSRQKFTGKERDVFGEPRLLRGEVLLGAQGRFTSPD